MEFDSPYRLVSQSRSYNNTVPRTNSDRAASKRWYAANRELQMERVRATQLRNLDYIRSIKQASGCTSCAEDDYRCLDFHHVDAASKAFGIYDGARRGRSLSSLDAEIAKCVVLCANCHRKAHAAEAEQAEALAL